MLRFEAALAQATAEAGLIPRKFAPVIAKACDPALYDPRVAGRCGAPYRHAHRAGGQGTDRRGGQAQRRGRRLRALGRHQPGRARHRHGAAARRGAAAAAEGPRGHRRGLRQAGEEASRARRCSAAPCCSPRRRWRSARRSPAGPPTSIARRAASARASPRTQIVQFGGASGSLSALGDKARPSRSWSRWRSDSRLEPAARAVVHPARARRGAGAGHRAGGGRARPRRRATSR